MIRGARLLPLLALLVLPAPAAADRSYTRCDEVPGASVVQVARASCVEAEPLAATLAAAPPPDATRVLAAAGWRALRALPAGAAEHDLVAMRVSDGSALRIRRGGEAPDLDGFAAGRELIFARGRIVGGAPIPDGAATCTSAFLIRLPGGAFGGLSAAHCGGLRSDGRTQRRNVAQRRPPVPGIVLGSVRRILPRSARLDALVVRVPTSTGRSRLPVVDRGIRRPPWVVAGTAALTGGRAVCYTGRTSGVDRCGRLLSRRFRAAEAALSRQAGVRVRCTTVRAAPGDSGGPVYTKARSDGTVRALGITTLVVGSGARMCFAPIDLVLGRLRARLVTG